ncbi:acanthoscurrin-2-like [Pistacia vera]|uniref:acanthoscurrin-2-like n=1 Tax=Pistacia vera TaxID=55513 RepID=UPI0012631A1C|nr:acanthoscurrin-2-like [Pistacia vera]
MLHASFLKIARGRKKKETHQYPTARAPSVTIPPPQRTHVDVEKGQAKTKSSGTKDGGMIILGGAVGLATGAAIASISSGCGGGGGGCGGGGCGGGGCGG